MTAMTTWSSMVPHWRMCKACSTESAGRNHLVSAGRNEREADCGHRPQAKGPRLSHLGLSVSSVFMGIFPRLGSLLDLVADPVPHLVVQGHQDDIADRLQDSGDPAEGGRAGEPV